MTLADVLLHALGNLRRQKLRTSLTMIGVALGVATITIMVSFGAGIRKIVAEKFDRSELLTQIQVQPVKFAIRSLDDFRRLATKPKEQERQPLNDETIAKLKEIPNVRAVYPQVTAQLTAEHDGHVDSIALEGLPLAALGDGSKDGGKTNLVAGAYWKEDDAEEVCVLPSSYLSELGFATAADAVNKRITLTRFDEVFRYNFDPPLEQPEKVGPDGKTIPRRAIRRDTAKTREIVILGVYDSEEYGIAGNRLHVPLGVARALQKFSGLPSFGLFGKAKEGEYVQLLVKMTDRRDVAAARERIEALGYGTMMTTDILVWINVFFAAVEAGLALFGGIGLFVACFGIANTMLMAVLERTREIGVLKALGGRDRDVRRMFLFEAATIGLAGGALGTGIGWLAGLTLNAIATWLIAKESGGRGLALFYVPAWLALAGIGVATFVAAISGLYPAWRAAKLDPVEALRRE